MALKARKAASGNIDNPNPGTYMARVVGITDLGHQPGYEYQGNQVDPAYQLSFTYELVSSFMQDGRPHWVSEDVKNSDYFDSKKGLASKLMKRVYALDPDGSLTRDGKELANLINRPCMVEVKLSNTGYPKVNNVTGAPNGIPVAELVNDPFIFDLDEPDVEMFRRFPEFIQKKIVGNLEFSGSKLDTALLEAGITVGEESHDKEAPF